MDALVQAQLQRAEHTDRHRRVRRRGDRITTAGHLESRIARAATKSPRRGRAGGSRRRTARGGRPAAGCRLRSPRRTARAASDGAGCARATPADGHGIVAITDVSPRCTHCLGHRRGQLPGACGSSGGGTPRTSNSAIAPRSRQNHRSAGEARCLRLGAKDRRRVVVGTAIDGDRHMRDGAQDVEQRSGHPLRLAGRRLEELGGMCGATEPRLVRSELGHGLHVEELVARGAVAVAQRAERLRRPGRHRPSSQSVRQLLRSNWLRSRVSPA